VLGLFGDGIFDVMESNPYRLSLDREASSVSNISSAYPKMYRVDCLVDECGFPVGCCCHCHFCKNASFLPTLRSSYKYFSKGIEEITTHIHTHSTSAPSTADDNTTHKPPKSQTTRHSQHELLRPRTQKQPTQKNLPRTTKMQASYRTAPPPYTAVEKQWLEANYGGEYHFLRFYQLSVYSEEDREKGRLIVRALIAAESG
jgi:hypothetical protein